MILTGKAKDDFIQWDNDIHGLIDTGRHSIPILFNDLNPRLQHTLIIEWFDSVGIYIITRSLKFDFFPWSFNINDSIYCGIANKFETRHEATQQAILKANDIYNKGA